MKVIKLIDGATSTYIMMYNSSSFHDLFDRVYLITDLKGKNLGKNTFLLPLVVSLALQN